MNKRLSIPIIIGIALLVACSDTEDINSPLEETNETMIEDNSFNGTILSNVITLEEAREELELFLKSTCSLTKKGLFNTRIIKNGFTLRSDKQGLTKSLKNSTTPKIHVFNFEDNGGFALMSATREMPSLLAITDGGNIDTNQVIDDPGLIMFLTNLEGQIKPEPAPDDQEPAYYITKEYGSYKYTLHNPIGGYCKVHWNQHTPFNKYCPVKGKDTTIAGCVAVACAQLMSVYKYPASYDGYYYNWSKMITDSTNDGISKLIRQLGSKDNLDMDYGVESSSADPVNIPRTLKRFGYSNGGTLKNYDKNEIVNEIKNGYCVLLGGFSHKVKQKVLGITFNTYHTGGHRWLVHGALTSTRQVTTIKELNNKNRDVQVITSNESTHYILCNFGWQDRTCNGYYLGDVFDTNKNPNYRESFTKSDKDYFYQYNFTMVTGIRK